MQQELVIYTCVSGNYDTVTPPRNDHSEEGVSYVCFSDSIKAPAPWLTVSIKEYLEFIGREEILKLSPRRQSRFFKFNPSLFFSCPTLWVDGNAKVLGDPRGLINSMEYPLGLFIHPKKRNLSTEGRYARIKSREREKLDTQMREYKTSEELALAAVYAGGVVASRRSQEYDALLASIWEEYCIHSDRDQLSISKVLFESGLKITTLPGRITNNRYAKINIGHRPILKKTRLELGVRGKGKGEWLNVDQHKSADVASPAYPLPDVVKERKWEVIKAIHFWEHLYLWEAEALAKECYDALEPGGRLVLECPSILSAAKGLLGEGKGGNKYIWHVLYGDPGHKDPSYGHKWGYTPETLRDQLINKGGFDPDKVSIQKARYHVPGRDFRIEAIKD